MSLTTRPERSTDPDGAIVEAQLSFAGFFVGTVALKTVFRQDWQDIAAEADRRRVGFDGRGRAENEAKG